MKPGDLFQVLAEIAGEHDAHAESEPLVIPVLVDELETRRELLEQAAEFMGGILLDLTSGAYDEPLEAFDDSELRGEVQTALTINRPKRATSLEVIYDDGTVDARLRSEGRIVSVPTPADTNLLALSRALFDVRLVSKELAMLLYSENSFDAFGRDATLQMLTGLARKPDLRVGGVRTVIAFIHSDDLSVARHCQANRGVRFSLTGGNIVRRNPHRHLLDAVRALTAQRDEPLVLFLAAGFSVSSGMPIGNAIRDEAIRRICDIPESDARSSAELAAHLYQFSQQPPRRLLSDRELDLGEEEFSRTLTLEQVVRIERDFFDVQVPETLTKLQADHNARLASAEPFGDSVYALHRIIDSGARIVLVTVNFDELVEHEHRDRLDVAVTDDEFERIAPILEAMRSGQAHPEEKVPLLKIHGTLAAPETCIMTDEETRSGVSPPKANALMALVRDLPPGRHVPWVYVGASMRDIDLDVVFSHAEFNKNVSERWVTPYPEDAVRRFVQSKQRYWASKETLLSRTITETSDAFMNELAASWA